MFCTVILVVTALHKRHLFLVVWQSRLPPPIPRSLTLIPPPKPQGSVSVTHHSFIWLLVLSDTLILLPAGARPWCHMLGVPINQCVMPLFIPHLLWISPCSLRVWAEHTGAICSGKHLNVPLSLHALFLLFRNPATAG